MTPEQRRYAEGLRWETELPPPISLRKRLGDVAGIVIGVLLFLLVVAVMQNRDLATRAEDHEAASARYAHMLALCMNGGALYDKTSDTAFFCDKVIAMKF